MTECRAAQSLQRCNHKARGIEKWQRPGKCTGGRREDAAFEFEPRCLKDGTLRTH